LGILELILIGLALSMDAFAVTIANSVANPRASFKLLFLMPVTFGIFQGLMPVIGFFLAGFFADFIQAYAGIISFMILGVIGGKMIFEGISRHIGRKEDAQNDRGSQLPREFNVGVVFSLAVATSIDALVVGVGFVATETNIVLAASLIAICTFLCCCIGLGIGKRFGALLGERAEVAGGVVLVLLGIKSLLF